ncbi:glycosyltransferase family 59 protein [Hypoxylon fragiforme]|uniref:glycosyltransferase family 59 protein n=1 Tax=Hypoxylon fragiforme TaxID=63214 RepID=UPI0020C666D2|nr:glycosyltransferase family 59 protein [Hypoxylon fragiforme]KAI2607228.1 glycosyltransferase family 59 protein [Hypoxylon fragiforme]
MASRLGLDPSFILQLTRYGLVSTIFYFSTVRNNTTPTPRHIPYTIFLCLVTIGLLARQWLSLVTQHAPEPYLDEVFHIPQAQVYCDGKYAVWDDKITTPPGLYALTILANTLSAFPCSVYHLRLFNVEVISYLSLVATICKARLERSKSGEAQSSHSCSAYSIWTGINVALFPVLFFFSGLYYTDIISTFVVLLAYANHLGRVSQAKTSFANDVYTIILGLLALCMRQTNIFWVVVYMGGQEVVHSIKAIRPKSVVPTPAFATLSAQIRFYAWRYSLGEIHDPPAGLSNPIDLVLCVVSISVATLRHLFTIVRRQIWPHLVIFGAFVGFVAWNGGVVLGDKSNHVATLHLAQMLYIWPLFAFFSAPLFIPTLLNLATRLLRIFKGPTTSPKGPTTSPKAPTTKGNSGKAAQLDQSNALKVFNYLGSSHKTHTILILLGSLVAASLIAHINTIIHPFTLADNRHYMFYVFRYTILRAWWVRYALVPAYVVCGWLCWTTLTFQYPSSSSTTTSTSTKPQPAHPSDSTTTTTPPPTSSSSSSSSLLILLLSTSLSLITAPLVEPRYFILPWVLWRLQVPPPASSSNSNSKPAPTQALPYLVPALETTWFLLINAATMYIFVTRPFYWRTPDGELADGGRVQRFMW